MAIPDFQSFMLPMLEMAADGREHSLAEARHVLAAHFGLSEEERNELLPSGRQRRFDNRVAWSKVHSHPDTRTAVAIRSLRDT